MSYIYIIVAKLEIVLINHDNKNLCADNVGQRYMEQGQIVADSESPEDYDPLDSKTYNQVIIDITTSFTVLVGIFFPSVTGE